MPLNYNTNTFVDAKQSLIDALKNPNSGVNDSNIDQYLKSINIDPVEFDRELKEEDIVFINIVKESLSLSNSSLLLSSLLFFF